MSLIRVYKLASGKGKSMINLRFVSSVVLIDNRLLFKKSSERQPLFGNFLFMTGSSSGEETIICTTKEEAEKEFQEICEELKKHK
jgi:hypothetical protein